MDLVFGVAAGLGTEAAINDVVPEVREGLPVRATQHTGVKPFHKVRPALSRPAELLVAPPLCNLAVVAAKEDRRDVVISPR
ncbi:hypothetical protein D3C73_1575710 [compost metagenome]